VIKEIESRNEEENMEESFVDHIGKYLQEKINSGEVSYESTQDLFEFIKESWDEAEFMNNVDRFEDVMERVLAYIHPDSAGLEKYVDLDKQEIIETAKVEVMEKASEGTIPREKAVLILEYLDETKYDKNGIFVESIDEDDQDDIKDIEAEIARLKMIVVNNKSTKEEVSESTAKIISLFEKLKKKKASAKRKDVEDGTHDDDK
jgi:hypothetical protein